MATVIPDRAVSPHNECALTASLCAGIASCMSPTSGGPMQLVTSSTTSPSTPGQQTILGITSTTTVASSLPPTSPTPNNQKTPISVLQEVCSRKSLTPEYKLISVEGAVHAPTFVFRVEVGEASATASGQSKKKAKHCAAKALIDKIVGEDNGPLNILKSLLVEGMIGMTDGLGEKEPKSAAVACIQPVPEAAVSDCASVSESGEEDGIPGNPVGQLQEMCMKRRWRPPFYETELEEGLPHERTFGIMCVVNNQTEMGFGKSKRLAKRQAAYKMIQFIEKMESASVSNGIIDPKYADLAEEMRGLQSLKEQNIPAITAKHSQQVSTILKQLKSSEGVHLNDLQCKNLNTAGLNYISILREIADEHKFEVSYVPAESIEGRSTCLCHLTTLPLAVCFGIGETEELAKMNAAHNALQYLKIVTKKTATPTVSC